MDKSYDQMSYKERLQWIQTEFWQGLTKGVDGIASAAYAVMFVVSNEAFERGKKQGYEAALVDFEAHGWAIPPDMREKL